MLGASARIGEMLAIRRRGIDVTSPVSSIRINGTIVAHHGEHVQRQDCPKTTKTTKTTKTAKSRRTVATAINEQATVDLAAEMLGHTDPKITIQNYIRRNEMVNPVTAEMLDRVFKKASRLLWRLACLRIRVRMLPE